MTRRFIFLLAFFANIVLSPLAAQSNASSGSQDGNIFYHTVERGQTVYAISTMYGVSEDDVYRLNPSSRDQIKPGERLKIPQKHTAGSKMDNAFLYHTVQPKETLYGLTKMYNVTAEQLTKANPGLTAKSFMVGKTIRIPATQLSQLPTTEVKPVLKEVMYTVKKKETIYSIRRRFNVSNEQLLKHNPELKNGLKAGMQIKIPVETNEAVTTVPDNKNEYDLDQLVAYRNRVEKVDAVRVALLLPFKSGDARTEYYEGFLMAVDSMKQRGVSVDLTVHDIGEGVQQTRDALQSDALRKCHLIIGGVTNEQIELIAAHALKNEIRYVIPFSSRSDRLVSDNGYLFQVNTPYHYLYSYVTSRACRLFAKYNVVIVNTNDQKDNKTPFIKTFKAELKEHKMPCREITFNEKTFQSDLTAQLSTSQPNLIVPVSASSETLDKLLKPLRAVAGTNEGGSRITLFGYPEWQKYAAEKSADFHKLNTHFYTSFYAGNSSADVRRFTKDYVRWYRKQMIASYPKYAMLGFDTGMYFMTAISAVGGNIENHLKQVKYNSLQTGFNFERINNWGGFLNTNIYFVRYNPDNIVTRF